MKNQLIEPIFLKVIVKNQRIKNKKENKFLFKLLLLIMLLILYIIYKIIETKTFKNGI